MDQDNAEMMDKLTDFLSGAFAKRSDQEKFELVQELAEWFTGQEKDDERYHATMVLLLSHDFGWDMVRICIATGLEAKVVYYIYKNLLNSYLIFENRLQSNWDDIAGKPLLLMIAMYVGVALGKMTWTQDGKMHVKSDHTA